jgi:hypothetical protein
MPVFAGSSIDRYHYAKTQIQNDNVPDSTGTSYYENIGQQFRPQTINYLNPARLKDTYRLFPPKTYAILHIDNKQENRGGSREQRHREQSLQSKCTPLQPYTATEHRKGGHTTRSLNFLYRAR